MNKNPIISEAIILAAGFGKRMQPLTLDIPKPLVRIMDKPIIYYILEELRNHNIKKCFINVHYLPDKIIEYIEVYKKLYNCMEIIVVKENIILDTGGAIKNINNKNNEKPIIVINGDSLIVSKKSTSPLSLLLNNFNFTKMDFLLLLDNFKNSIGYYGKGDFSFSNKNNPSKITRNTDTGLAYTGWQILNPQVINHVKLQKFSLNYCYDESINNSSFWGIMNTEKWLHIGTMNALNEANKWLENNNK